MSKQIMDLVDEASTSKYTNEAPNTEHVFTDEQELKGYIKHTSLEELEHWANLLDVTWVQSDNEPINRMRIAMAIKKHYFPIKDSKDKKGKKNYSQYSNEDLKKLIKSHKIPHRSFADKSKDREAMVKKLKAAGVI